LEDSSPRREFYVQLPVLFPQKCRLAKYRKSGLSLLERILPHHPDSEKFR
jgi:hypothetical protein